MTSDRYWNLATVIMQSILLFFALFLICAMSHFLGDIYKTMREGAPLPAMTHRIQNIIPRDTTGMFCLAACGAMTNFCIGIMLILRATEPLSGTQSIAFHVSATWGLVLVFLIIVLVALILPFVSIVPRLPTAEECKRRRNAPVCGLSGVCFTVSF